MSDDVRVVGGIDGVTARYTDMRRSGELLMGMSTMFLTDAAIIGGYVTNADVLSSAVFAPVEAIQVETTLTGIGLGLGADAVELGVLGTFLVGAVEAYQLADEAIAAIETSVACSVSYVVGTGFPAIVLVGGSQFLQQAGMAWGIDQVRGLVDPDYDPRGFGDVVGDQAEDMLTWLQQHPGVVDLLTRGSPGLINGLTHDGLGPGRPLTYEQAVATILGHGSFWGSRWRVFHDGDVQVRPTSTQDDVTLKADPNRTTRLGNLSDVLTSLGELDKYDQDNAFSRIRVVQSVGDDGVTRWIVQIPSTQEWMPTGGPALNDSTACLIEMADQSSQLEAAIRDSMRQAGIQPGDPVMLSGFSLGGITAGHLASDPSFTSAYNVEAVLTAGSPVARFEIADDIQVLSIEHYNDLVPHLDGLDNPDRTNWTTVTDSTPTVPNPDKDAKNPYVDSHHNALTYARTANNAQESGNRSISHYMDTVAPFLEGAQTISDFRAERVR